MQRNDKIGLCARKIILTTGLKIGWGRDSAKKRQKHGGQLGDCQNNPDKRWWWLGLTRVEPVEEVISGWIWIYFKGSTIKIYRGLDKGMRKKEGIRTTSRSLVSTTRRTEFL